MTAAIQTWNELPFDKEVMLPLEWVESDNTKLRPVDEERVQELMLSFKAKGQRQAIEVRPNGGARLKVTFGEHRLEAAKRLGWQRIRGVIKQLDELEALEIKVTENAHRNSFVDPWEEGRIFAKLLNDKYHGNLNALSESLGKSTSYIKDRTQVYYFLHPSLKQYIGNKLTISNVVSLAKTVNPEPQLSLAAAIVRTRTKNLGIYGGGGLSGRVQVKDRHKCPDCGKIHDISTADIDGSERMKGQETTFGRTGRGSDTAHFENPKASEDGYSYCGYKLTDMWSTTIPADMSFTDFRPGGSTLCGVCLKAWRRQQRGA